MTEPASASPDQQKPSRRQFWKGFSAGVASGVVGVYGASALYLGMRESATDHADIDLTQFLKEESGSPKINDLAPDFTLKDLEGKEYALAHYKHSTVLLNFWDAWCPPCRKEVPLLHRLASDYKGRMPVLTITGDTQGKVRGYVTETKLSLPVLIDSDERVNKSYEVQWLPTSFLLHNGRIAYSHPGVLEDSCEKEVRAAIDELLLRPVNF